MGTEYRLVSNRRFFIFSAISELKCTDHFGKEISNGQVFQPKPDPCFQCTCDNGFATMCKSVSCIPPTNCFNPVMIEGKCCKFHCEEDGGGGQGNYPPTNSTDTTNKNNDNGLFSTCSFLILRYIYQSILVHIWKIVDYLSDHCLKEPFS